MEDQFVKVEDDNGNEYNMLILKEFDYKNKKYAVLMETDKCSCGDDCDCGCDDHCDCGDDCKCGCDDHCDCGDDCKCGCNEKHDSEPMLCLLEITKDEKGEEMFVSIEDEKLFDEVVKEADKVLYE